MKRFLAVIITFALLLIGCANTVPVAPDDVDHYLSNTKYELVDEYDTRIQNIPAGHFNSDTMSTDDSVQLMFLLMGFLLLPDDPAGKGVALDTIDKLTNEYSGIEHIERVDETHRLVAAKAIAYEKTFYLYSLYEYKSLGSRGFDWYSTGDVFIFGEKTKKDDYNHIQLGDTLNVLFSAIGINNYQKSIMSVISFSNKRISVLLLDGVLSYCVDFNPRPKEEADEGADVISDDYWVYDLIIESITYVSYEDGGIYKYPDGTGKAPHLPIAE